MPRNTAAPRTSASRSLERQRRLTSLSAQSLACGGWTVLGLRSLCSSRPAGFMRWSTADSIALSSHTGGLAYGLRFAFLGLLRVLLGLRTFVWFYVVFTDKQHHNKQHLTSTLSTHQCTALVTGYAGDMFFCYFSITILIDYSIMRGLLSLLQSQNFVIAHLKVCCMTMIMSLCDYYVMMIPTIHLGDGPSLVLTG